MNKNLTIQEQNLIKDILRIIGNDYEMNKSFARAIGMSEPEFNAISDSAFEHLGNGRLIVQK